jgi:hypothetical protein
MKRTARDWRVHYQKDEGFTLRLEEKSLLGEIAARLLLLTDAGWLGRYHNLPWCWINPWGWTWKAGVDTITVTWTTINEDSTDPGDESQDHHHTVRLETANLGSLWMSVGNRVLNFANSLELAREVTMIPVSNDWVRENLPDTWKDYGFLVDDTMPSPWDEDEGNDEKTGQEAGA